MVVNEENENFVKYKKKRKSNTSLSRKRSNHKHLYHQVLFRETFNFTSKTRIWYSFGCKCAICGFVKSGIIDKERYSPVIRTQSCGTTSFKMIDNLPEVYPELEIVDFGMEEYKKQAKR